MTRAKSTTFCWACGALATLIATAVLVWGAPAVAAQEATAEWTTADCREAELMALASGDAWFNSRAYVDTKVVTVFGTDLVVRDVDLRFLLAKDIREGAGKLDEGDNLRLFGWLTRDRDGKRLFYVKRYEPLGADTNVFQKDFERIARSGDLTALHRLADEIRTASLDNPELQELHGRVVRRAVEIERARIEGTDTDAIFNLYDTILVRLGDRREALHLLVGYLEPGQPVPPEFARRLRQLNAVRYGRNREWVLFDDVKEREGFVQHGKEWVLPERKQLLEALEAWQQDPRRGQVRYLTEFFLEAQLAGNVVEGMSKRQVVETKDQAYPTRFDRTRVDGDIYDGWFYANGAALFFENDVLFKRLAPVLQKEGE